MAELSIIIPVRDDAARLGQCLASIGAADDAGVEVIVADNGSRDESAEVARRAGARVLSLPGHNVAWVRNSGAGAAAAPVLAFVDADHTVDRSWLAAARAGLGADRVGAVGAAYLPPADGTWVQQMYGALRGRTVGRGEARWLGSGNMVVRRAAFDEVGGFDESLEACEDVDFCNRLRGAGWQVVADERLRSTHHGDPPTLGALFRAERWRGRDNLRVSLRAGLTPRDLPSVAAPIFTIGMLAALIIGPALWAAGCAPALILMAVFVALGLLLPAFHAVRIAARAGGVSSLPKAAAVAFVYHLARAVALVAPRRHHRQ